MFCTARSFRAAVATTAALVLLLVSGPPPARASSATADASPSRFIITVAPSADAASVAADHARRFGVHIKYVYRRAVHGYAADATAAAIRAMRRDARVETFERDQPIRTAGNRAAADWGLDRLDQPTVPLDGRIRTGQSGAGVTAYIIDTGIRLDHEQFGGRAESGFDAVDGGAADDCNGHGTHVAGTVGGRTLGVAPNVQLIAVRVMDCDGRGSAASVIAGIDWVTAHHVAGTPAVANMSVGGAVSRALDAAVRRSIASGVSYAVAAGNGDQLGVGVDACSGSPGHVREAMTVGASDETDRRAEFSNTGRCVDWYAPGVNILSAWPTSSRATNTLTGTSMAAPHTAGVAALYLEAHPAASPAEVQSALRAAAFKGVVRAPNGRGAGAPLLSALVG